MSQSITIDGSIIVGSDNVVVIDGLRNTVTDAYVNDAAVSLTLKDNVGNDIGGIAWPVVGTYETASNGKYQIPIDKAAVLTVGQILEAIVTAVSGGSTRIWRKRIQVALT